jgi:hypothetical protein
MEVICSLIIYHSLFPKPLKKIGIAYDFWDPMDIIAILYFVKILHIDDYTVFYASAKEDLFSDLIELFLNLRI